MNVCATNNKEVQTTTSFSHRCKYARYANLGKNFFERRHY